MPEVQLVRRSLERVAYQVKRYLTILEASKPEQHKIKTMLPRTAQAFVQLRKVELVFLGFDLFPGNTPKDSVEIRFSQFRPRLCHVLGRCEGRVLELASTHQKWLAIDDELLGRWRLSEVRNLSLCIEVAHL